MNTDTSLQQAPARILMVGIGGYGHFHYGAIRELEGSGVAQLVAIVDPAPQSARDWPDVECRGIPVFASLELFFEQSIKIDLAVVVSPISCHADQTCALLDAGIHVLCEKPIAATVSDALRMRDARDRAGCFLEIGYQWSFSDAIQNLKEDIIAGHLGRAEKLLTRVCWPRGSHYYGRNSWVGKNYNSQGEPVYDSPVNNATAHYLHNMLFVLGSAQHLSATPISVTAECYRANRIENFDTACCRIETLEGPDIYFYTTHACETADGPFFTFHFEKARVDYSSGGHIVATFSDGTVKDYGDPEHNRMQKISRCIQKTKMPERDSPCCSVEAAMAHTRCVEALQRIPVKNIEARHSREKQNTPRETLVYIPGIEAQMQAAFEAGSLFSEQNLPWAGESHYLDIAADELCEKSADPDPMGKKDRACRICTRDSADVRELLKTDN